MDILNQSYLGNTLLNWIYAGAAFLVVLTALSVLKGTVTRKLLVVVSKTETDLDDFIAGLIQKHTKKFFFFLFALYAGALFLVLPGGVTTVIRAAALLAFALQVGLWGNGLIEFIISRKLAAGGEGDEELNLEAYSVITWLFKAVLWTLVSLVALNNLGIEVTALVAGLGVSGIAVALAVQNILGDLFASMSIVLDKPFVIGDFIIVGDKMGNVEHVGLKTTRVRSLSGEQIVFANTDLLASRIQNYGRMNERRINFNIGVTYQTPSAQLALIPEMIREIVEAQERVRFDRSHFASFGASSLDYETIYYVLDRDFALFRDTQQAINLALFKKFEEEGIEFAYPTQTLFVEKGETT
jgi:small-conductance mechanosensitive channel